MLFEEIVYNRTKGSDWLKLKCKKITSDLLEKTGHIVKAHNVADGAGFCMYRAKMKEAIGVASDLWYSIPGKVRFGSYIHRILGLAIPCIMKEYITGNKGLGRYLDECIDEAIEIIDEKDAREADVRSYSFNLALNLLQNLRDYAKILGIRIENLRPIVEQQFIDYELGVVGTPDLILEDANEKKAIVVEWKTGSEKNKSVNERDCMQVLVYALLEARRLGYSIRDGSAIRAITGVLDTEKRTISDIKILPVIIRPTMGRKRYYHPIFERDKPLSEAYSKYIEDIKKVIIAAEFLRVLQANPYGLLGPDLAEEAKTCCVMEAGGLSLSSIRTIDLQLFKPGSPRNRETHWKCKHCPLKDPCGFYFAGDFGSQDGVDKMMWSLRFRVYDIKEKDLYGIKGLYKLFENYSRDEIINWINKGYGFIIPLFENTLPPPRRGMSNTFVIEWKKYVFEREWKRKEEKIHGRIDVVELEIEELKKLWDNPHLTVIKFTRKIREHETQIMERKIMRLLKEGRTIRVSFNDANNIFLTTGFFGRIDDYEIDDGKVTYTVGLPSNVFQYSLRVLAAQTKALYYLDRSMLEKMLKNIVIAEVPADLTHIELNTIDILHRELKNLKGDAKTSECLEEYEEELKALMYGIVTEVFSKRYRKCIDGSE